MLIALFSPFLKAETPEEVKKILKEEGKLPTSVYKALFRKGIMNNMSAKMRAVMLPIKEPKLALLMRKDNLLTAKDFPTDNLVQGGKEADFKHREKKPQIKEVKKVARADSGGSESQQRKF